MTEFCEKCGQPEEICVCSQIEKEAQRIRVRMEKRKFGKKITVVTGLEGKEQVKMVGKELKRRLACGGTIRNEMIELQGDHKNKVKDILIKIGYSSEAIDA